MTNVKAQMTKLKVQIIWTYNFDIHLALGFWNLDL